MRVMDFLRKNLMRQRYLLSYDVNANGYETNRTFRKFLEDFKDIKFYFKTESSCTFTLSDYEEEDVIVDLIEELFKEYKKNNLPNTAYLDFVCTPCLHNLCWRRFNVD